MFEGLSTRRTRDKGARSLSVGQDGQAIYWNKRGDPAMKITASAGRVWCASVDWLEQNDPEALTGGSDRLIKHWSLRTGRLLGEMQGHDGAVEAHSEAVTCLAVRFGQPYGDLITGSADGTLGYFDMDSQTCAEAVSTMTGHNGNVTGVSADWSTRRCLSAGTDGKIKLWDIASGIHLRSLNVQGDCEIHSLSADWDEGTVLVGLENGMLELWNFDSLVMLAGKKAHRGATRYVLLESTASIAASRT
eukprot:TRINITY_DN18078_c0_g1_i6.p1 TRINITY_DN18078_c0_g1~~TRINITY_DN18078_c0_g1_i6.p1  ORF type:complete len:247 (-),score=22.95 TRINITY_DN18078_c0_g1_i6:104-844(-)